MTLASSVELKTLARGTSHMARTHQQHQFPQPHFNPWGFLRWERLVLLRTRVSPTAGVLSPMT
jgi:hypothetical protein